MKILPNSILPSHLPLNVVKNRCIEATKTQPATPAITGEISQAQQALSQMPEVDSVQVAAMKAVIQQGQLPLDADSLAQAMMDYFRR